MDDKENTAPLVAGRPSHAIDEPIPSNPLKKGRSKSMGPGGISPAAKRAFNRRRSALPNAVKSILPGHGDAERKAARRKSMADRRVSFAPEATLHTWDVIDYLREHTNSTASSDGSRRSPRHSSESLLNGTETEQERYQGLDNGDTSDTESSHDENDAEYDDDTTSGSVAFDMVNTTQNTLVSNGSASSTSSSAQLDRNLRIAAEIAGTRGIDFDEYGDMSMDMVEDEITNAFQPWANSNDKLRGSAAHDQENVDPFLLQQTHHKQLATSIGSIAMPETASDVRLYAASDDEQTMEFTSVALQQAFSKPVASDLGPSPRKRTAAEMERDTQQSDQDGSPRKRRRSEVSGFGAVENQTMEFTRDWGSIKSAARLSYASIDENEDMSMELTTVLGGIKAGHLPARPVVAKSLPDVAIQSQHSLHTPSNSDPPTQQDNDTTPTRPSSARSRRASASPGRRSSARLRNAIPQAHGVNLFHEASTESSPRAKRDREVVHEDDAPTAEQSVTRPEEEMHSPLRTPRASARTALPSFLSPGPLSIPQSSPFQSVVASPSVAQPYHTHQPSHESLSPIAATVKSAQDSLSIMDNIRLLTTPRKQTLRERSPKKASQSPIKNPQLSAHVKSAITGTRSKSPMTSNDNTTAPSAGEQQQQQHVSLQHFLDEAGIRFMDLSTSKRRATIVPTPLKPHSTFGGQDLEEDLAIPLDEAIVSAACTEPELELYKHACNELRRYIDGGKADIKTLEEATLADTPVLISRYMAADTDERANIDAQLREIKTNARLRSKEMWYSWRSNLVDDLMKVLQSIAEGLLNDDEVLQAKEGVIEDVLPQLLEDRSRLRTNVDSLQVAIDAISAEQKEELALAREQLEGTSSGLEEKRKLLAELEAQAAARDAHLAELNEQKSGYVKVIERSEAVRAVNETGNGHELANLQSSIDKLQTATGWQITSSTARPSSITMRYKSELDFFFDPLSFAATGQSAPQPQSATLSLSHVGQPQDLPSCQRFFLQLLRARLHTMDAASVKVGDVLHTISSVWALALRVSEASRSMSVQCPTTAAIVSDECLRIESTLFMPSNKTKVAVILKLTATTQSDDSLHFVTGTDVKLVYGRVAGLEQAKKRLSQAASAGPGSWAAALCQVEKELSRSSPQVSSKRAP